MLFLAAQFFPKNNKSDKQQDHAHDKVEVTGGNKTCLRYQYGKTGDSSECKVVREFEKYKFTGMR